MGNRVSESRMVWLGVGLAAGLCISYFWPHEPVLAASNDRDSKFGMATAPMGFGGVEGVFVLDYLTGQMTGVVLNNRGVITHVYRRNVAADFSVEPKAEPHYAFVPGRVSMSGSRKFNPAPSVIYVGELSSGKVIAYTMNYRITQKRVPPQEFIKLAFFSFREATAKD